jgi:hypothetical protein
MDGGCNGDDASFLSFTSIEEGVEPYWFARVNDWFLYFRWLAFWVSILGRYG